MTANEETPGGFPYRMAFRVVMMVYAGVIVVLYHVLMIPVEQFAPPAVQERFKCLMARRFWSALSMMSVRGGWRG